jgi:D-arabinitol 4-dehydrogenase
LEAYRDVVLERFGNPAIADTNQRVAMDAFSKIPGMIVPTIRDKLAKSKAGGASFASVAMLPALFLAYLQRWHAGQIPYVYQDQAMDPDAVLWGEIASDPQLVATLRVAFVRVQAFVAERGNARS